MINRQRRAARAKALIGLLLVATSLCSGQEITPSVFSVTGGVAEAVVLAAVGCQFNDPTFNIYSVDPLKTTPGQKIDSTHWLVVNLFPATNSINTGGYGVNDSGPDSCNGQNAYILVTSGNSTYGALMTPWHPYLMDASGICTTSGCCDGSPIVCTTGSCGGNGDVCTTGGAACCANAPVCGGGPQCTIGVAACCQAALGRPRTYVEFTAAADTQTASGMFVSQIGSNFTSTNLYPSLLNPQQTASNLGMRTPSAWSPSTSASTPAPGVSPVPAPRKDMVLKAAVAPSGAPATRAFYPR